MNLSEFCFFLTSYSLSVFLNRIGRTRKIRWMIPTNAMSPPRIWSVSCHVWASCSSRYTASGLIITTPGGKIAQHVSHHFFYKQKKRIRFENTLRHICTVIFLSCFIGISIDEVIDDLQEQFHWNADINVFWPHDLDIWPMTLTFDLWPWPANILPLDLHAKIEVRMSVHWHSAVRVVTHKHTQTDTRTDDVKMITPVADAGCKNDNLFCISRWEYFSVTLGLRSTLSRKLHRNQTKIEENFRIPTSKFY